MNYEITEHQNDVTYDVPQISFPSYEKYRNQALAIRDEISGVPVSQDNIKEVKKTLAGVRKISDRMNRARIDIKKAILANYEQFEAQVKEITGIIDDADHDLRSKVKLLDELEREAKRDQLREIWDMRVSQYGEIEQWMPDAFDIWLQPKHLNKTTTIKNAEADMTAWIDQTYQDMVTAQGMGEDYLYEYIRCRNLGEAIRNVKDRSSFLETIDNMDEFLEDVNSDPVGRYTVFGAKDIALTDRLLNENEINYKKEN